MKTMQQYWVTKKSVSRKFGGKEDECIVASDAELDAKLELFRSIAESCTQLQKVIDSYQERICILAQEENACGRYLKECGKNEKNPSAGQIMSIAGKSLAYCGHQRLTLRPSLVRLHHEVETFRGRAVSDTRITVAEMEKARTAYRAALSWMKSVSAQLDPDTGHGLEKFRKAQTYVRSSKVKFDRLMLACLQKVDLLAAARCNMFSHALVGYQRGMKSFSNKTHDTLNVALTRLQSVEPYDFSIVSELSATNEPGEGAGDKDKKTFFNSEYSDQKQDSKAKKTDITIPAENSISTELLGEDFSKSEDISRESTAENSSQNAIQDLFGLTWPCPSTANGPEVNSNEFMPSSLIQQDFNALMSNLNSSIAQNNISPRKLQEESQKSEQMSWLSMFAELDPLAQDPQGASSADRA